ncbi:MAG: urease accessory protein UreD [Nitrospira sp.]
MLEAVADTSEVGRVGALTLDYARQGNRTVLTRSRCSTPWHFSPPIELDDSACLYTPLLNPSGGVVGGDRLSVMVSLGPRAHVLISTPSATRVYRSLAATSVQSVELSVGPDAILEWMPEVTIPYAGARFKQTIHAKVARGGTLLLWDAMASGRMARGERWAFTSFENEIWIDQVSGKSVLERYHLNSAAAGSGLLNEWDYVGSLFLFGDGIDTERLKRLEEQLVVVLDKRSCAVLGGVSEPDAPGIAVKLMAKSAPDLSETLDELWLAIRATLWNLPRPALRRY